MKKRKRIIHLPIETWQHIFDYCNFKTQFSQQTCKLFNQLKIHNMIPCEYVIKLTDEILKQGDRYKWLEYLNAFDNPYITNVNHMVNLRKLDASGHNCGINDDGISELNLVELHTAYNRKITNVNHMTKLEILYAISCSGIDDKGISELNLKELNAAYNEKITNINYMTKLEILYASGYCGIDNNGIEKFESY